MGFAKRPPSWSTGLAGLSAPGRGLGAVPRRSAKPGPLLSTGLVSRRGEVSFIQSGRGELAEAEKVLPPDGRGAPSSG